MNDKPLVVVTVRVNDPDRVPVGINRCDAAQAPTGFAEIVSDYSRVTPLHFPLLFDKGLVPFEELIEQHRLHKIVGYSGGL